MKKRILATLLILGTLICTASCGEKTTDTNQTDITPSATTETASEKEKTNNNASSSMTEEKAISNAKLQLDIADIQLKIAAITMDDPEPKVQQEIESLKEGDGTYKFTELKYEQDKIIYAVLKNEEFNYEVIVDCPDGDLENADYTYKALN